jgi:amino-acid N-acetyltransferase
MTIAMQTVVRIATFDDFDSIVELLQTAALPVEDIKAGLSRFFVAEYEGKLIGVMGLEIYDGHGLLRSVAVDPNYRNRSIASTLLGTLLKYAADKEIRSVYLITTTAQRYFEGKGFTVLTRDLVPKSIQSSTEFSTLCPSTAAVMTRQL